MFSQTPFEFGFVTSGGRKGDASRILHRRMQRWRLLAKKSKFI